MSRQPYRNPFFYGYPVAPDGFLDRREALRRITGRLLSGGQSSAIVGQPRMGKTSLLNYLAAPESRTALYNEAGEQMLFSYLDSHMLSHTFTAGQFWQQALAPIKERLIDPYPDAALAKQYALCQENVFGNFTLEVFFRLLREAGWRLILLLDEFDVLLSHPILNSAEFFGGLRSLTSRGRGALAMVTASRLPLADLNEQTQQAFKFSGSPYFNFLDEVRLGPFPERDVAALLEQAAERFTLEDRQAICQLAGRHPFLLQAAAAAMWDAWEQGLDEAEERYAYMAQRLHRDHQLHFDDCWRLWTPATRKLFTTVALTHANHLLPGRRFLIDPFIKEIRDYGLELDTLEASGILARDPQMEGGWRVVQEVMLWWLADELVQVVRADVPFEEWLREQELEHLLTPKEREQLRQVMNNAADMLQRGATSLVEAFVRSHLPT